ncbi:MAG: isoleucine--tRNA ligase [Patescibacteria group bacterium]
MNQIPKIEEKILKFWQKENIFAKSVKLRKNKSFFSFYDGPPFASGLPHYGHILASTIKDTVLRYWAMKGHHIFWRVGWDCHGLPVENMIEEELGLKSKKDIEELGIDKFNQACRKSVFRCVNEWYKTLNRVGRWSDYSNPYATLDNQYIESVWWVFKQLWDQGLVYQDYRITPYCPRCGTPLSNFELNQPGAYQEVEDESVFIKFPLKDEKNTYFLVWTTTPWTLAANTGIAVHPDFKYVKVKLNNDYLILVKDRLNILGKSGQYQIVEEFPGKELTGKRYQPLYPMKLEGDGYRIVGASFVSAEDGTGLVHIAPTFGEEDMELGKRANLPGIVTVDEEGKIIKGLNIPGEGKFVKTADADVKADLKKRGLLFREEKITHAYPFCWRCDSPLLYYPINSWYIAVTKFKRQLVENNKKICWVPGHLKQGRFGKWLEGARDWSFSRNRYWGAPIPIWQCQKCDQKKCIGSVKELSIKLKDLHRPTIDQVVFKCSCGGKMKRIPEVFDCWFESGSMPYAQWHYPFENKQMVEKTFPADFIAEGMDQTRGWFYTLHVLATALTLKNIGLGKSQPAFKNVIVNGLVLGEDGKKLSKRLKNYTPPEIIFDKYGADTLRYFLLTSSPMGEDYIFSEKRVAETFRRTIMTLWNSFVFLDTYTDKECLAPKTIQAKGALDEWIISRVNSLNQEINKWMGKYELTKAARLLDDFIDDFSNWYIRRSRRRFQRPDNIQEKKQAEKVYSFVFSRLAQLAAPFLPFITEEIYQHLVKKQSVHLTDYPRPNQKLINQKLEEQMSQVRQIAAVALAQRAQAGIKVRQPLAKLVIDNKVIANDKELVELLKDEINVREIVLGKQIKLDIKLNAQLKNEGIIRDLIRFVQDMRKHGGLKPGQKIYLRYSTKSKLGNLINQHQSEIQQEVTAGKIEAGPKRKEVFLVEKELKLDGQELWLGIKK